MNQFLLRDMNISKNIVRLRKKSKMTQEELSIRLQTMGVNISRSRLSMIELNRLNIPLKCLVALKIILKCQYSDFFEGLEEEMLSEISNIIQYKN